MKERILKRTTTFNNSLQEVFNFFGQAENLNKLTPPHLNFQILTPMPIKMGKGTLIDYKLKLFGVPFYWRTEITVWEPPFRFVDIQVKGPYKKWVHEHIFREEKEGKVLMEDIVTYKSPGGLLEPIIHKVFVERNLNKIFKYREDSCKSLLDQDSPD